MAKIVAAKKKEASVKIINKEESTSLTVSRVWEPVRRIRIVCVTIVTAA
jgi:hypothetical protein